MVELRPPDPHQIIPLTDINTPTERNLIAQTTEACLVDLTVIDTIPKIAYSNPPLATSSSGQNQTKLNSALDSATPKTFIPTVLDRHIHPVATNGCLDVSGDLSTEKNGAPTIQLPPNVQQKAHHPCTDQFPPLTSNFDPPVRNQRLNTQLHKVPNPPHARLNAQARQQQNVHHNTGVAEWDDVNHATTDKIDNLSTKNGANDSGGVKGNELMTGVAAEKINQTHAINDQAGRDSRNSFAAAINLQGAGKNKNSEDVTSTEILHGSGVVPKITHSSVPQEPAESVTTSALVPCAVGDVPVVLQNTQNISVADALNALDEIQFNKAVKYDAITELEADIALNDPTAAKKKSNTSNLDVLAEKNSKAKCTNDATVAAPGGDAVPLATAGTNLIGKGEESTKAWVERSFGTSPVPDKAPSGIPESDLALVGQANQNDPTSVPS